MGELDENRVRHALATAKIQSFSSELVALQSCRDEDALYDLLIKAIESEPFLLSRVVRVANSVAFAGLGAGHAMGANECLLRIGLSMGKQIAEDFLIDQALGRIARANRFSRGVWREARLAGYVVRMYEGYCEEPFNFGGPSLPAIMSYLGELFVMSLIKAEYELPSIKIPVQPNSGSIDLVGLSLLAFAQLQLPEPVEATLRALPAILSGTEADYARSAAAVLLSRAQVREAQSVQSFTASVPQEVIESAKARLGVSAGEWTELGEEARRIVRLG